jgi:hypothetical protein
MHAMKRLLRQILLPAVLAAAALALVAAGPASAAGWKQILRDCVYNEGLKGDYTRAELNNAKRHITGERIAYTECTSEIQAAISRLAGSGKGKGGGKGGSGDGFSADLDGDGVVTKAERKRAAKIRERREREAIEDANDALRSDSATGGPGGGSSGGGGLPLILAVTALGLAATGGGTWFAARRNPAIANALRRVQLPGRRG